MAVLGVDAFPKGWVGVAWDGPGSSPMVRHAPQFADLITDVEAAIAEHGPGAQPLATIGVDIPIGLPEKGERRSDSAVRSVLGPRRSSLFATPVRAAVLTDDWDEAQAVQRRLAGKGMSKQSHALRHSIRQVAAWEGATGRHAYEVHPELSFAVLAAAPGSAPAPMTAPKTTWSGAVQRRELLARVGLLPPDELGPSGQIVPPIDILDAAVVAWSAWRIAANDARRWPADAAAHEAVVWS